MNRKQLRAKVAFERKHALKIAQQHASSSYDLDNNGNYILVRDPIAVKTLFNAFHKHLLGKEAITYKQLLNEQSLAFLSSGDLAPNTVSVMAVTRDQYGEFRFAIERCSSGSASAKALLKAAKAAAEEKIKIQLGNCALKA
jgi:hypothetical protein